MLCLNAYGKINWTLDVLGVREDGYHLLDMLLQSVSLYDTLRLEESDELALEVAGNPGVPADESNLVMRAGRALQKLAGPGAGARLFLEKRIPSGAGMGGGSADAAAALIGLNRLWKLELSPEKLDEIGLSLGADVPFMLHGGLARVGGIGEQMRFLAPAPAVWLVLIKPCAGLSTKEVFRACDRQTLAPLDRPDNPAAQRALLANDLPALARAMGNALQGVSAALRPEIAECAASLERQGALKAMMTGSGSVVYGVFAEREGAKRAYERLAREYPHRWLCKTVTIRSIHLS